MLPPNDFWGGGESSRSTDPRHIVFGSTPHQLHTLSLDQTTNTMCTRLTATGREQWIRFLTATACNDSPDPECRVKVSDFLHSMSNHDARLTHLHSEIRLSPSAIRTFADDAHRCKQSLANLDGKVEFHVANERLWGAADAVYVKVPPELYERMLRDSLFLEQINAAPDRSSPGCLARANLWKQAEKRTGAHIPVCVWRELANVAVERASTAILDQWTAQLVAVYAATSTDWNILSVKQDRDTLCLRLFHRQHVALEIAIDIPGNQTR